ncbi:MAG TPA: alkaline phosphatase family protein, partial [Thermoanaerobaculia bacterium]
LRGRRRLAGAVTALAVVALLVNAAEPLSRSRTPATKPAPPAIQVADTGLKVMFVGLDGADWRVIQPMMEKGELPAFAALMREGASGDLATLHDSNSAVIWASIYTGATPDRHGIDDFYRISLPGMTTGLFPVHRTYFKELADLTAPLGLAGQVPVDRFSLKVPPIWEIADRAGLTTGVVDGYFYSFPALRPSRPESWFFTYGLDMLADRASPRAELFVQPKRLFRDVRPLLKGGDFYWQSATLLDMLAKRPQPRFVNFYTHEPDTAQHFYWKWWEPRRYFGVTEKGLRENAERIPRLHRDFDAFLARLRERVDPDTVILVASDHGHSPTIVHSLYTQHRHGPPGIVLIQGGPVRRGAVLQGADIYDLYPTVLYLLGLPVPRDTHGKILLEALDPAFVRAHPVRSVPSYAGLGLSPGIPGATRDGEMNEAEIEKLKALGYIF